IYAGAIFAFALLYLALHRDFHHPYVKHEGDIRDAKAALGGSLGAALEAEFARRLKLGGGGRFQVVVGPVKILGEPDAVLTGTGELAVTPARAGAAPLYFVRLPLLSSPTGKWHRRDTEGRPVRVDIKVDDHRRSEDAGIRDHPETEQEKVAV